MKPASEKPLRLTREAVCYALDKAAAECVEELLLETGKDGGKTWFSIIRKKMNVLYTLNCKGEK